MEKFQELILAAKRKIQIADHILNSSYKLVGDPKILLSATTSIYTATQLAMHSALEYERLFKRVPAFSDNFDSQFTIFKTKIAPKHEIETQYLKLLKDLREIQQAHQKSPVEFTRKDKFVIASEDYELKTLELNDIKKYLTLAKKFITKMESFTSRDNGIFR